ncbi:MAG: hypothetical protein IJ842_03015 [Bacilli bacterium]|nr:hypothetical protein [Bacilli bacterium]
MKYEKSKDWNLFIENNKLFVSRGADEIYYFDEANDEQAKTIYDAYCNDNINYLVNDPDYYEIINKMEKAGIIYKKKFTVSNNKIKLYIKYYGKPNDKLKNEIISVMTKRNNIRLVDKIDNSDLALLIRINVPLRTILEDYSNIKVPHILIDLGYANNISIGPIVYEETACLSCYIGRVARNWGDLLPPDEPAVTKKYELIASLVLERIEQFIIYGNCPDLINCVWNFNTNTYISDHNKIYKLPWCPHCNSSQDNPKIDLPWEKEFDHE